MLSWSVRDGTGKVSNRGDQTNEEPRKAVGMSGYSKCSMTLPFNFKPLNDFPRRAARGALGVFDVVPIGRPDGSNVSGEGACEVLTGRCGVRGVFDSPRRVPGSTPADLMRTGGVDVWGSVDA